jgi:putative membrane protein
MTNFDDVYDPGLQQERTVLAWDRTGLALMVTAGLLERSTDGSSLRSVSAIAAVGFVLGLALLVLGRARYLARWRRMQDGIGMLSPGPVVAVAAATILLGISALYLVFEGALG